MSKIDYYNLDMIIALGYRVQSDIAVRFRIWATKRLHEYIQKCFTMDDERLKRSSWTYSSRTKKYEDEWLGTRIRQSNIIK